jgi:hypothetical protein
MANELDVILRTSRLGLRALISNEAAEELDHRTKISTLWHSFDTVLEPKRAIAVVGTLENEAEAFGHQTNLSRLATA